MEFTPFVGFPNVPSDLWLGIKVRPCPLFPDTVPIERDAFMENNYRIKIVREDGEFEAEGDKKFVLDMLAKFEGGSDAPKVGGTSRMKDKASVDLTGKSVSVREFIQRLGLKKHTDIGLAFGYYIEHSLGKASFTPADVNNCYYEAKMETSNTSQMIIQNIKAGRMMPAKKAKSDDSKKKSYTLTTTGEEFIAKRLKEIK